MFSTLTLLVTATEGHVNLRRGMSRLVGISGIQHATHVCNQWKGIYGKGYMERDIWKGIYGVGFCWTLTGSIQLQLEWDSLSVREVPYTSRANEQDKVKYPRKTNYRKYWS